MKNELLDVSGLGHHNVRELRRICSSLRNGDDLVVKSLKEYAKDNVYMKNKYTNTGFLCGVGVSAIFGAGMYVASRISKKKKKEDDIIDLEYDYE